MVSQRSHSGQGRGLGPADRLAARLRELQEPSHCHSPNMHVPLRTPYYEVRKATVWWGRHTEAMAGLDADAHSADLLREAQEQRPAPCLAKAPEWFRWCGAGPRLTGAFGGRRSKPP